MVALFTKPKLNFPMMMPTLAVGQPFVAPQVINRPVNLVDDQGNVHGRIGENGQESVTIQGNPNSGDPPGGPNYASGGQLLIGDSGSTNPYPNTIGTGIFSGNWQPPTTQPATQPGWYTNPAVDPNQQIWDANQQQLSARNNALQMRQRVLEATQGTFQPQRNVFSTNQNVLNLRGLQNQAQFGYLRQVGQNEQQNLAEEQAIYGASQNAPDLLNVAAGKQLQRAEARRASKMGVSPAEEVNLPPGYNGHKLPGVTPKIMSQEERLKEKAGYERPIRNSQLALARNAVDLMGTNVQEAQLAAQQAGLTLDEAQQMVREANLSEDYANLGESYANLNETRAKLPPEPGDVLWTDPVTGVGQWVTPDEKFRLETQYRENVQQPYGVQLRGQGSSTAALNEGQLLNTIPNLPPNVSPYSWQGRQSYDAVLQELVRRYVQQGYSEEQAAARAFAQVIQELEGRKKTGTVTEIGGQPAVNVPAGAASGTPPPASAPTGTNSTIDPDFINRYVR